MEKETIIVKGMTLSADGKRLLAVSPFFDGIIPEGVEEICDGVFEHSHHTSITVVLPSTLTSMGAQSFAYCESLEEVFVNGCPKDWNGFAFIGNECLKEVHINEDMHDRLINECKTKDPKFIDKLTTYNL